MAHFDFSKVSCSYERLQEGERLLGGEGEQDIQAMRARIEKGDCDDPILARIARTLRMLVKILRLNKREIYAREESLLDKIIDIILERKSTDPYYELAKRLQTEREAYLVSTAVSRSNTDVYASKKNSGRHHTPKGHISSRFKNTTRLDMPTFVAEDRGDVLWRENDILRSLVQGTKALGVVLNDVASLLQTRIANIRKDNPVICSVQLFDHEERNLYLAGASKNLTQSLSDHLRVTELEQGNGVNVACFESGIPVYCEDVSRDDFCAHQTLTLGENGIGSHWTIPLQIEDETWGVVNIFFTGKESAPNVQESIILDEIRMLFESVIKKYHDDETKTYNLEYDLKTGILNDTYFTRNCLPQALSLQRKGVHHSFLLLDVDRFSDVSVENWEYTDKILSEIARRLSDLFDRIFAEEALRVGMKVDDFVLRFARLERDQFALVGRFDQSLSERIFREAQRVLQNDIIVDGRHISMTASVALLHLGDGFSNVDQIFRAAGFALQKIQLNGGHNLCVHTPYMTEEARFRRELEADFRKDVKTVSETLKKPPQETREVSQLFPLRFQPKVSMKNGKVVGGEALVRWNRNGKLFGPDTFIPLAEREGLIIALDSYVMREACLFALDWQQVKGYEYFVISVNISSVQLNDPNFYRHVLTTLQQTGLRPECLELEVTETDLMKNFDDACDVLDRLRKHGVKISIDDFGDKYSSLKRITRMPVDTVKVDRGFMKQPPQILVGIIALIHGLGKKIVVEGVEQDISFEMIQCLLNSRCDLLQGYAFPPESNGPISAHDMRLLLQMDVPYKYFVRSKSTVVAQRVADFIGKMGNVWRRIKTLWGG